MDFGKSEVSLPAAMSCNQAASGYSFAWTAIRDHALGGRSLRAIPIVKELNGDAVRADLKSDYVVNAGFRIQF
jgi:hypothetical protein